MVFQKPFVERPGVLDDKAGDPEGYVTNDGMCFTFCSLNYLKRLVPNLS